MPFNGNSQRTEACAAVERVVRDLIAPHQSNRRPFLQEVWPEAMGAFGLNMDMAIVVEHPEDADLAAVFGPSVEPLIPFQCIKMNDSGIAIELVTLEKLNGLRSRPESGIFAKRPRRSAQSCIRGCDGNG